MISIFSLVCLLPFWLIISGSFSSEAEIVRDGFKIFPSEFTFSAYQSVFSNPQQIFKAYLVSISLTAVGTLLGLFFISMAGYVLSRFSGGLIPWYILIVKYLDWKDSYLALLVPMMISAWNIILMKNSMKSIPESVVESTKIDGAGEFTIDSRLIFPLSTPGLATISLFLGLLTGMTGSLRTFL